MVTVEGMLAVLLGRNMPLILLALGLSQVELLTTQVSRPTKATGKQRKGLARAPGVGERAHSAEVEVGCGGLGGVSAVMG